MGFGNIFRSLCCQVGGNRFYSEALVLLTEAGDLCNGYLEHKFSMTLKVSSNLNDSVIIPIYRYIYVPHIGTQLRNELNNNSILTHINYEVSE